MFMKRKERSGKNRNKEKRTTVEKNRKREKIQKNNELKSCIADNIHTGERNSSVVGGGDYLRRNDTYL
jgi:hypothetical protein